MTETFPPSIGAPATRAITRAGILSWTDLRGWSEAELSELHGVGPKAVSILGAALDEQGKAFALDVRAANVAAVENYLNEVRGQQRETLEAVRAMLLELVPFGREQLSYGMPAITAGGKPVAGYAAFKTHCAYLPHSGSVLEQAGPSTAKWETSKGGLKFDKDSMLTKTVVRKLVKLKMAEIGAVDSGTRVELGSDGRVKAVGKMSKGELHGPWKWFRKDGSLMRSGSFKSGEQTGPWVTYDKDGNPTKTTQY